MSTIFITSSGTNIGKTYVTALLTRQFRARNRNVRALKPVISGFDEARPEDSDTGLLLQAQGLAPSAENISEISPWRFRAALSPDMAASREKRTIDFAALIRHGRDRQAQYDPLLIEGVGGIMVPLDERHTVLDWMQALDGPGFRSLLVVGSYLGTISHTLTALAQLRAVRLAPQAIIVSETPGSEVSLTETIDTITRFAGQQRVIGLAQNAQPDLVACLEETGN